MSSYPEFMKMVNLISMQNPLQKKRINNFISEQDTNYWVYAEEICSKLNQSFLRNKEEQIEAARSYNRMSMDFLREQIRFSKTGVYRLNDANLAQRDVYNKPDVMRCYMLGLLLSYLLWPNHFQILSFLKDHIKQIDVENYLDIAPGHGLFVVEVLRRFPNLKATLLDISETSIQLTNEIISAFEIDSSGFDFINGDFLSVSIEKSYKFDFISMGEVLEHVNDVLGFLKRARSLLKTQGTIFMSTCANCPAIDHIYHFRNADEIRSLIKDSGLSILKDRVLPVEAVAQEGCLKELEPINYCAILAKEKS